MFTKFISRRSCITLHAVGNFDCNWDNCGYVKIITLFFTAVCMHVHCKNVLTKLGYLNYNLSLGHLGFSTLRYSQKAIACSHIVPVREASHRENIPNLISYIIIVTNM